nr:MAG TPA: hypothetical protein [Caudoviricetes sp.]
MDYLEGLRSILNEINVGSDQPSADNTTDDSENDGDQNFMDDGGGEDTTTDAPEETTDDSGDDDGDQNFMDDGGEEDTGEDTTPPADDTTDEDDGDQNFMDDGGEEDTTTDDTADASEETTDDSGDDDADQNFMDGGGGEDTGEGGGDDASGGDGGGETTDDSEGENSEESEEGSDENGYDINKIEEELFSSLTPEQIAIKNHELKNQFIELYSIIGSTLVRINDISKTNDNINVLKFITEKLLELREMIDFNITTAYQTRTYIENNIIYQQCIATLNAIAEIIDNIPKLDGRDNSEEEESEEDKNGIPVDNEDEEETHALNISDTTSGSTYQEESAFNSLF